MTSIISLLRRQHRQLSIIISLPMILMSVTGIISPILDILQFPGAAELVRQVHTGKIFFGSAYLIYTVLSGVGLLGLIYTGLSMLKPFSQSKSMKRARN